MSERHEIDTVHRVIRARDCVGQTKYGPLFQLPSGNVFCYNRKLKVFVKKGTTCIECGAGALYYQEKPNAQLASHIRQPAVSLTLYVHNPITNTPRALTRDHIYPRSLGGSNGLNNMQPMCDWCNGKKGTTIPDDLDTYNLYSIKKLAHETENLYQTSAYSGWITYWVHQWFKRLPVHEKQMGHLVSLEAIDKLRYELWLANHIETDIETAKVTLLKPSPIT